MLFGTDMSSVLFNKKMQALLLKMLMMVYLFLEYCSVLIRTNHSTKVLILTTDFIK